MLIYDDFMRTIIDIPEELLDRLAEICEREGISRAEAIRRAIAELTARGALPDEDAFGLWRGRARSALEIEDRLRSEWGEEGPTGARRSRH